MSENAILNQINHYLEDIKAIDIMILDVKKQTTITDYMIICSGRSSRHVKSIAQNLVEQMKNEGTPALHSTGLDTGEWALIDFGDYIVHVMQPETRAFYNLEDLWQE